jgi:NADPH:quinone reductase
VEGSEDWKGKNVFGTSGSSFSFTTDGAQAEYAVLPEGGVAQMPEHLSFVQAASLGTPWTTATALLQRAQAQQGETVMILGATGSVGSASAQIAKLKGLKVLGVGRHGTEINSVNDPELKSAKDLTGGKGPDIALDTVGDFALTKAAFDVLANNGRLATITAPRGGSTELPIDILSLYRRQISIIGCNTVMASQEAMAEMLKELAPAFDSDQLQAADEKGTNVLGIDQALDAYNGKAKKAVIVFD